MLNTSRISVVGEIENGQTPSHQVALQPGKWQTKLLAKFQVDRKEAGEAAAIRGLYIVLVIIDQGKGESRMPIDDGVGENPPKVGFEAAPSHQPLRDI